MRTRNLLAAMTLAFAGAAAQADTITIDSSNWGSCLGNTACTVSGANLSGSAPFDQKYNNGATGLGVSTSTTGEIDIGEFAAVDFGAAYSVTSIQLLFLYNGPEYDDLAEIAQITADNVVYTLSLSNLLDDDTAVWSGTGSVIKCGATINQPAGTGCFLLSNPFATAVQTLRFTALPGIPGFAGPGTNDSDYALGMISATRNAVPEPGSLALLSMGLLGLGASARRRKSA